METFDLLRAELHKVSRVERLTMLDLMELPDPLRQAMTGFVRQGGFTASELRTQLGVEASQADELTTLLVEKGFLRIDPRAGDGEPAYRISLGRLRGRNIPIDL